MSGKSVNFGDTFFYKNKKIFKIDDIDVDKIVVSKNESFRTKISLKHFIWYNDKDIIRSLCTKLPQMIGYVKCFDSNKMIGYVKCFDSNKTMSFKVIW